MTLSASKRKRYTYKDYLLTPEGGGYELLEGDLRMVPAPATVHQRVSGRLYMLFREFITKNNLGEIFYAPTDVYLDDETVLQPDILFISEARKDIVTKKNIQGAPDLVVEIISPGTAYIDRSKKKKLYARFGVGEYWLVDPEKKSIEVYGLKEGKYVLSEGHEARGVATSPVLPGLAVALDRVF